MFDFQSIVIYFGLAVATFFIGRIAEERNNKNAVWLIVGLLSLVAGLRNVSVGIDTKAYNDIFTLISSGDIKWVYGVEKGFIYLCSGLLRIWDSNQFLFLLFAFVSHALILFRIWEERRCVSFSLAALSYYVTFFAFSLNGLRQFIAVAIVIYSTLYIKEGKYTKYLISILVATLFHTSALIGTAYLFLDIMFSKHYEKKRKRRVLLYGTIIGVAGLSIVERLIDKYSSYLGNEVSSFGFMMIVKIALLVISIIEFQKAEDVEDSNMIESYTWYYFIGLILNSLSYFLLYAGRIGLYFYIFEAVYVGKIFKSKKDTVWMQIIKIGYVALLFVHLYDTIFKNGQGHLPYRFFWQE